MLSTRAARIDYPASALVCKRRTRVERNLPIGGFPPQCPLVGAPSVVSCSHLGQLAVNVIARSPKRRQHENEKDATAYLIVVTSFRSFIG